MPRWGISVMVLPVALLLTPLAHAQNPPETFVWYDAAGTQHVAPRIADLPEPFRGAYLAEQRAAEERERAQRLKNWGGKAGDAVAPGVAPADRERYAKWRQLVARWRGELLAASRQLVALDRELARLLHNPVLRHTPGVQAEARESQDARGRALQRLHAARQMLLQTLPDEARRQRVPLRWLEG